MAEIIKADGTIIPVEPKNGKDFKLEELNKIVGGYIEIVYLTNKRILVVDEEGKLKQKPFNVRATTVSQVSRYGDFIAGDALLCLQKEVK